MSSFERNRLLKSLNELSSPSCIYASALSGCLYLARWSTLFVVTKSKQIDNHAHTTKLEQSDWRCLMCLSQLWCAQIPVMCVVCNVIKDDGGSAWFCPWFAHTEAYGYEYVQCSQLKSLTWKYIHVWCIYVYKYGITHCIIIADQHWAKVWQTWHRLWELSHISDCRHTPNRSHICLHTHIYMHTLCKHMLCCLEDHSISIHEKPGLSFCSQPNLAALSPSALPSAGLSAACLEVNSFMIPLSVLPIFKWLIFPLWQLLAQAAPQLPPSLFGIIEAIIRTAIPGCYRTCDIRSE